MTLALAIASPMWIFAHINSVVGTAHPPHSNYPTFDTEAECVSKLPAYGSGRLTCMHVP